MKNKNKFSIIEGSKLFVLLMLFIEVGAIFSHLALDRTILKLNISVVTIILLIYSYHFLYKKKEEELEN